MGSAYKTTISLPESIQINGHTWQVLLLNKVDEALRGPGWVNHTWGYCDPDKRQIEILKRLRPRSRLKVFLHEYLHACEYEYGYAIPHAALDKTAVDLASLFQILQGSAQ